MNLPRVAIAGRGAGRGFLQRGPRERRDLHTPPGAPRRELGRGSIFSQPSENGREKFCIFEAILPKFYQFALVIDTEALLLLLLFIHWHWKRDSWVLDVLIFSVWLPITLVDAASFSGSFFKLSF